MADTLFIGAKHDKLYLQSGEFSSILKTSQPIGTIDGSPSGIAWDRINTLWSGLSAKKMYLQSGLFTSILKTSQVARINNNTANAAIRDISWDRTNTVWVESGRDALMLTSGQFTSIIKTSLDVTSIDSNPRGISYDNNGNTPWCGMQADKLYLQSGQFTSLLKTSLYVGAIDSSPEGISATVEFNTPWVGNQANKLYLTSGQFSSILKDSQLVADTSPLGIDSTSRLDLALQVIAQTLNLTHTATTGQIPPVSAENNLFLTQENGALVTQGTDILTFNSQELAIVQEVSFQFIPLRTASNTLTLTDEALPERTHPAGDVVADTIWSGDANFKLFLQSGRFTSTVKTSQVVNGGSSATVRGVSSNSVDTPWVGHNANLFGGTKMYMQSGQFTSTLKTSTTIPGLGPNDQANGISTDGEGNTAVLSNPPANTRLILFSGEFTTTVKSSVSIGAGGGAGLSWMKDDVMWCDEANDKLKIQSGHITSTLKTSQSISSFDTNINDCAFTGGHTLFVGSTNDKLFLLSGSFTSTLKTSQSISTHDTSPSGIETDNIDARLQNAEGDVRFLQNSIDFVQTVSLGPISQGTSSTLVLTDDVDINFEVTQLVENTLVLTDLARQNLLFVTAENTLALVAGITANIADESVVSTLNLVQTVDQNIEQVSVLSTLILEHFLSFVNDKTINVNSTLELFDTLESNQELESLSDTLELTDFVSVVLDTSCLGAGITLTYPFENPQVTVVLRKPDFGNLDRLEFTRINRESRGGTLQVFRDEIWPRSERQSYQFSMLSRNAIIHLLDFFAISLGKEVGLLDHESRQWRGVILTPDTDTAEQSRGSFVGQFDFEGELV